MRRFLSLATRQVFVVTVKGYDFSGKKYIDLATSVRMVCVSLYGKARHISLVLGANWLGNDTV